MQRLTLMVVPRLVWLLLQSIGRTWRFEVLAEPGVTPAFHGFTPGREIYCFWHQCVLACAFYYRSTQATILISQSFDGELITRTLELFGYRAVRGSSSRGGREGMVGLWRVLDGGTPAIFTADGPRGPIYQIKSGCDQIGAGDGCAHRRFSPGAGKSVGGEILGPLSGAQAIYADCRELGAVDEGARRCRAEGSG